MDDKDYFDDIAACAHDIELMQQHLVTLDAKLSEMNNKLRAMDQNLFMTVRGIMTLMEDVSFAAMPSDGFTADQKAKLNFEQAQARLRVRQTIEAMKKAMG